MRMRRSPSTSARWRSGTSARVSPDRRACGAAKAWRTRQRLTPGLSYNGRNREDSGATKRMTGTLENHEIDDLLDLIDHGMLVPELKELTTSKIGQFISIEAVFPNRLEPSVPRQRFFVASLNTKDLSDIVGIFVLFDAKEMIFRQVIAYSE